MPTRSPTPPTLGGPARPSTSSSSSSSIPSLLSTHAASSSQQPATMASSGRPGRGSAPSLSSPKPSVKPVDGDRPTRPSSSKDSLKAKMKKPDLDVVPRSSKSEEQLRALRSDFDSLRSHLTCKICDRLLYQPYIISCGHTYCYSCLCTWFVNNKARKTCPDCRAVVAEAPAPAYLIREMTTVFISRAELLPPGETIEQHSKWQKEEADIVQQDKDNQDRRSGGLFKGCFRQTRAPNPPLRAVRDQEDGVDRCPLCSWELEDGECQQCGLFLDENGELSWGDSFTGFSDMDEMSERDMSGEDLDAEIDMEDAFDGYEENMAGWPGYMDDEQESYMMRRYLEHGIPPQAYMPRRRLTHSEAGSRRSYSQSIVSDMYTEEMDTVEEEDEDGADEDSSMNDFIDDDNEAQSASSPSASSTPSQTPQPSASRQPVRGRARRVVESETSSTASSIAEEDEEDEGPIRRGQRSRPQTRNLNRASSSREPTGPPSSTSTEASHEEDLDEDTQALLRAEDGWMLQHDGPDEEMEEDDYDSDGGRTTVGWEPTAISNDRVRMGGSLTPTADRPRPNGTIRPPSRTGNPRLMDASRGLRRRSSTLSTSTVNYEDGEADDDDSDRDQDGDITMAMNALRQRRSQAQMRNSRVYNPQSPNPINNTINRFANRGFSRGDGIDLDTDDNSDTSQSGRRRNAPNVRPQEYNPRISWMFADHQRALQEFQRPGPLLDLENRSTTPIARPRTANRNRVSPAPQFSPFMAPAPARLRTPLMDNSSNQTAMRGLNSPPRRAILSPTLPAPVVTETQVAPNRAPSISSVSSASNASDVILTPSTSGVSTPTSQQSVNAISQAQVAAAVDMIDRPPSRVSARPPSASGRRGSVGYSPVYPGFPHNNIGLNVPGRILQNQRLGGNPWAHLMQQGVRPRNSRPALRDQSSTATLRAVNSRINIRDAAVQPQGVRSQPSRVDLRPQPSRRRLANQSSTRTLRASEHARPPQSPALNAGTVNSPAARSTRPSQDEREIRARELENRARELVDARARELVSDRLRALGGTYQPNPDPVRTNPFTQGFRRNNPAPGTLSATVPSPNAPHHVRSNSNESAISANSSTTAQATPPSPNLNRRRSNRNMTAPPALTSIHPGTFSPPTSTYANNYLRARQGSMPSGNSVFESPLSPPTRAMNSMVAASGPLI